MNSLVPLTRISQRLGVPPRTLIAMSREGSFVPIYSLGRCKRVDPDAVEAWLSSRTERAIAERQAAADQIIRTGSCTVPGYEVP